jgi:protoporphyrin/coproporphyrin ferrochelatase
MGTPDMPPVGILLMAYGTPSLPDEVEPYYTDVRGGRPPTPQLLAELQERYRLVGGRTPLLEISRAQAAGLQAALDADAPGRYRVYLGMKHWHPYIAAAVREMAADGVREALAVALAPHYSKLSIGGYISRIEDAQAKLAAEPIHFTYVESWHDEPLFWQAVAERAREALAASFASEERARVFVLFTAHSLPQRIREWDDPYQRELLATARGVAGELGLAEGRWDFAFQSAGRTPEPWLGPDILEKVRDLVAQGERSILVCPIGFIADHLEIFYDIDVEARQLAKELGIHLERIEMLNARPSLVVALEAVVRKHMPAAAAAG